MSVLFRYFAQTYLASFLRVFLGLGLMVALIDMIEISRQGAGSQLTLLLTAQLALLRLPSFIQTAVPFMVLIASLMTFLALNKRQELVISRASGLSVWQFIAPVGAASFAIGLVVLAVFNPLASYTFKQAETREVSLGLSAAPNANRPPWLREARDDGGSVVIGAERSAENGTLLSQPRFYFLDQDGGLVSRIDAELARLTDGAWVLSNAVEFDGDKAGEPANSLSIPSNLNVAFLGSALSNPEAVPFFELPANSRVAKAFGLPTAPYTMAFQALLAMPALLVAMTLIASTVSLRFARFGQNSAAIMGGVLAGFLLYVVTSVANTLGASGVLSPIICAWLPVVAVAMFGVTLLLHGEDG
jgi:lipopolysaccharide export system permease protein